MSSAATFAIQSDTQTDLLAADVVVVVARLAQRDLPPRGSVPQWQGLEP